MKYRVRLDLSFDSESDAQALMDYAKQISGKAVSINEGRDNEEIAFTSLERCFHDEVPTKPCERIERVEVTR